MKNKILTAMNTLILFKAKVQNNLMKVCLIVNGLYAVGGIVALAMMASTYIMK